MPRGGGHEYWTIHASTLSLGRATFASVYRKFLKAMLQRRFVRPAYLLCYKQSRTRHFHLLLWIKFRHGSQVVFVKRSETEKVMCSNILPILETSKRPTSSELTNQLDICWNSSLQKLWGLAAFRTPHVWFRTHLCFIPWHFTAYGLLISGLEVSPLYAPSNYFKTSSNYRVMSCMGMNIILHKIPKVSRDVSLGGYNSRVCGTFRPARPFLTIEFAS